MTFVTPLKNSVGDLENLNCATTFLILSAAGVGVDVASPPLIIHPGLRGGRDAEGGVREILVNGARRTVQADPDTPLLYVLQGELGLKGPRFGCGLAQCGSCSVLADGVEIRACVTPVSALQGKAITTLEGLPAWYAGRRRAASEPELHPVQQAMIDEQAVQCGYCYNGMIIKAAELLERHPDPTEAEIRTAMNGHICRCGTYPRIIAAIRRAAAAMAGAKA